MVNLVERPDRFTALADPQGMSDMVQVAVTDHDVIGRKVEDLHLPGDSIILLGHRGEITFMPHSDSHLENGDIATVAGERESVADAVGMLAG